MTRINVILAALLFVASQPAWADDYSKFYQVAPGGSIALLPSTAPAEIVASSGNLWDDTLRMWERGYALMGYSSFNGQLRDPAKVLKFAKKLKARYVVTSAGQVSEANGVAPLTLPTSINSRTFGNMSTANNYGSTTTGTFDATTMTIGSQTTYIPFAIRRADQVAAFFNLVERKGSGVYGRELTNAERALLGTNHAMVVLAVREGSPAFNSDIVPGDILMTVNEAPFSVVAWNAATHATPAKTVRVELRRRGTISKIAMVIPSNWNVAN